MTIFPADLQQAFQEAWIASGLPLPGTFTYKGKPVNFSLKRGEHLYLYFDGRNGVQHCYTPHPSTDGDYFVWDYVPQGKGARSGNASRYKMKNIVRCARAKVAKAKARKRSLNP